MSIPQDRLSTTLVASALLAPDDIVRADRREDYELGGVAINDPSQGNQLRNWRAWVDGDQVKVAPWPENTPVTTLFTAAGVTEISLTFDQVMHPTVAFVQAGIARMYWFDTVAGMQVTTTFAGVRSPMVTLDDKRSLESGVNDVLLFYLDDTTLAYRQQRDRFLIERVLATVPAEVSSIQACGMGANGRLQIQLTTASDAAPALFADLSTDTMYAAVADAVCPLNGGDVLTARWLGRVTLTDEQPSLGWVRVDASAYPVTLRLFGDGVLVKAVEVLSDAPTRLPATRAREWQIEVIGAARVTSVRLAEVRQELEADDGNPSL